MAIWLVFVRADLKYLNWASVFLYLLDDHVPWLTYDWLLFRPRLSRKFSLPPEPLFLWQPLKPSYCGSTCRALCYVAFTWYPSSLSNQLTSDILHPSSPSWDFRRIVLILPWQPWRLLYRGRSANPFLKEVNPLSSYFVAELTRWYEDRASSQWSRPWPILLQTFSLHTMEHQYTSRAQLIEIFTEAVHNTPLPTPKAFPFSEGSRWTSTDAY